jgi:hypothetical protein
MAYPQTLTDLQNDVLSRLNEASNSTAGDLRSGTGGSSTIGTAATITQYLNEASADIARYCYPIVDVATYTSLPATTLYVSFANSNLTLGTSGDRIWAARSVSWNGTPLGHASRSATEHWYGPTFPTDTGTPLYWYEQGADGIGIYPTPSTAKTLSISGLVFPPLLTNGTDVPTWFQADQVKLIVFQAAGRLALKNADDPSLAERGPVWLAEYQKGKEALLARLWQEDPDLAAAHFPSPTPTPGPSA